MQLMHNDKQCQLGLLRKVVINRGKDHSEVGGDVNGPKWRRERQQTIVDLHKSSEGNQVPSNPLVNDRLKEESG